MFSDAQTFAAIFNHPLFIRLKPMKLKDLTCPNCGYPAPDYQGQRQFQCESCGALLVMTDLQKDNVIVCEKCRTVNPDDYKHCQSCGEKLTISCPFCYVTNHVDADNCYSCGVNLRTARKRKEAWVEENARLNEERFKETKKAEADSEKKRLRKLIKDLEEPDNHSFAIYCLNQMGNLAVKDLIDTLLNNRDPDARFGAAIALGNIKNTDAIPALAEALQDKDASVRYWAIDALQKFKRLPMHILNDLRNCLNDTHKGVREKAHSAILALGGTVKADGGSWWPF